jgi:ATP:ADP antiporter, AAA family
VTRSKVPYHSARALQSPMTLGNAPAMTPVASSNWPERLRTRLTNLVQVEPHERAGLAWSFIYFFCVLAAYYIVRPVREDMGVLVSEGQREHLFLYVFLVMLAAVPVFGWIVSTIPRRLIVPVIYSFFILNLIAFRMALAGGQTVLLAQTFFVWASVFNLFTISLFWIVMSEHWDSVQAKRLYGVIAAGGSVGGIAGPVIAQALVKVIGPNNLLLISAAFLALAMIAALQVRAAFAGRTAPAPEAKKETSLFEGALQVWRSPYLFQIALAILVANVVSTFFYLEQLKIVGAAITDRPTRVQLFARMDLAVSIGTILLQICFASLVMSRLGVGIAAGLLPATAILGFMALAVAPVLSVIVAIIVVERAVTFSIASPAMRVLYTLVSPEEKYRAQNFIDTVVFRGGDAISGSMFGLMTKTLGFAAGGVAAISIPLAALWLALCLKLGHMHTARAKELQARASAKPV